MKTYLIVLLSLIALSACSSVTGKYEEVGQTYKQITGIKSLRVVVKARQPKHKEWEGRLADQMVDFLKKEKVFKSVTLLNIDPKRKAASVGDLGSSLDAVVWLEDVTEGNSTTRALIGTGEAVAKATVVVKRSENGQEFSRFKVEGNSAHKSESSVNGVNITRLNGMTENLTARALVALAEHFTEYFSDKISR